MANPLKMDFASLWIFIAFRDVALTCMTVQQAHEIVVKEQTVVPHTIQENFAWLSRDQIIYPSYEFCIKDQRAAWAGNSIVERPTVGMIGKWSR